MRYNNMTNDELVGFIYSNTDIHSAVNELERRDPKRANEVRRQLGWRLNEPFGWLVYCSYGEHDFKIHCDRADAIDHADSERRTEIYPVWIGEPEVLKRDDR